MAGIFYDLQRKRQMPSGLASTLLDVINIEHELSSIDRLVGEMLVDQRRNLFLGGELDRPVHAIAVSAKTKKGFPGSGRI